MKRSLIPFDQFALPVFHALNDRWMLLASGENRAGEFNVMTVSWGGLGVMWNKPFVMVVVRPSRYTFEFMEKTGDFTLSAFPGEFKDQLTLCGTRSGRALDKVKACGFTPIPSSTISSPGFDEAELTFECSTMYYQDIDPSHFMAEHIEKNYGGRDYHRLYLGEIKAIHGMDTYRR